MKERIYSVYVHTNKINGKRYVGATSRDPRLRWSNGIGYKSNVAFYEDILKYGWESFNHDIPFSKLTRLEADTKERELIKQLNTTHTDYGYNKSLGGCIGKSVINSSGDMVRTISITMDQDLYNKLKISATNNYRTIGNEITVAIKFYLRNVHHTI